MAAPQEYSPLPVEGIFPSFFMSGFECSTFLWKDGQRKNYIALTGHDGQLERDYERLKKLGIGVIREGIPWPFVDQGSGQYDWTWAQRTIDAANRYDVAVIWDLCHYGFPDDCNPMLSDCLDRFVDYCMAAAKLIMRERDKPHFFTPVNEITFLTGACTDMGWMYPFADGRYDDMKRALCRMAIAGVRAIREVDPDARMIHVDPLIYEVAAPGHPELEKTADEDTYQKAFEAWDMLAGKARPDFGGAPEILDIVGVNMYSYCQAQLNTDNSRTALGPRDPRRKPLSEMLKLAWDRYQRPILIGETSGAKDERPGWLNMVMHESLIALNDGVDLQGVCLFPGVDMPDWQTGEWARIGIFDVNAEDQLERIPFDPYIAELQRWQEILRRSERAWREGHKDERAPLAEVRDLARRWEDELNPGQQAA